MLSQSTLSGSLKDQGHWKYKIFPTINTYGQFYNLCDFWPKIDTHRDNLYKWK